MGRDGDTAKNAKGKGHRVKSFVFTPCSMLYAPCGERSELNGRLTGDIGQASKSHRMVVYAAQLGLGYFSDTV
jgi:hypothetical protein